MAAREPKSRHSRRGSRRATKDLEEVATQVAQAAVDGELSDVSPSMQKFPAEAPEQPVTSETKGLSTTDKDASALLLRLPTPSRRNTSPAAVLPSPPPTMPAPMAAPQADGAPAQAPTQPPTQPPTQAPMQPPRQPPTVATASPKGPEPWSLLADPAAAAAPKPQGGGGYREFLQARGQQAMQRSAQLPPMLPGARAGAPGAVPPPPAVPAPNVGFPMQGGPSTPMAQCYADMSPMSQMSPMSNWYGGPSFEMPPSPMMQGMSPQVQTFSPCMQQAPQGTPQATMVQSQPNFMMSQGCQQGYMTPTGCHQGMMPQQPAPEQQPQQPQQQQWGQEQLQSLLMPEASFLDRDQVAEQLRAAAAACTYED